MIISEPTAEQLEALIGTKKNELRLKLCELIASRYEMDCLWGSGGKRFVYEYKYRRGGKTLCALYMKQDYLGIQIIFGAAEREKFEVQRELFSPAVLSCYECAVTYHDGKWLMLEISDELFFPDVLKMLAIKRKPNRK